MRIFSVGFLAGVYTATLFNVTSALLPMLVFSTGFVALSLRLSRHYVAFLAGLLYFLASASHEVSLRLPAEYSGDSLVMRVVITDFPIQQGDSLQLVARPLPGSVLQNSIALRWYQPPVSVRLGDEWQLEIRARPPRGLANPGGHDAETHALGRRLAAVGYVVNGKRNRLLATASVQSLSALRQQIATRISSTMPANAATPVLVALSIGSRHLFSEDLWRRLAASGLSHLVAISGLHIGLVAGLCVMIGRCCMVFYAGDQRRLAVLFGLCGGAAYLLLSGVGVPAQRAYVMLLVFATCLLLQRELSAFAVLSLAALAILFVDPLAILQPGLWLSFSAVAWLFWWGSRQRISTRRRNLLHQLWSIQCLLFLALLPITTAIFGRLSLSAPIVNLIAVPVFSIVAVPATLIAVLVPPAAEYALLVAAHAVHLVMTFAHQLDWLAPLEIANQQLLLIGIAAILTVALPPGFPGRLCVVCAIPLLIFPGNDMPAERCFRTTFFDVGQGTSVLVETSEHRLLYDTGPPYGDTGSAFASVIAPSLQRLGVVALDRILVSHADADHAGGIRAAVLQYPGAEILVGERLEMLDARPCRAGQAWVWDSVTFQILHPGSETRFAGNNQSCVLRISTGRSALLLSGDIEIEAETQLLQGHHLQSDIASVPHHGSRTSSSSPFVAAVAAQFAIVQAGHQNRFGHPKEDVVRRWQRAHSRVINTSESGAVRFLTCADRAPQLIESTRDRRRKLWHVSRMGS